MVSGMRPYCLIVMIIAAAACSDTVKSAGATDDTGENVEDVVQTDSDAETTPDTPATPDTETKPEPEIKESGPFVVSVSPSDEAGLPAPEVTPEFVNPAWEWAFLAKFTNGFPLQPRVSIQLSEGPLDIAGFTGENVFVRLVAGEPIPIMQRIYDPKTNTLHFLPARYLQEDTYYEIVTTDGLSVNGKPITASVTGFTTGSFTTTLDAIRSALDAAGPPKSSIVAAQEGGEIAWTAHRRTQPAGSIPLLPWNAYELGSSFDSTDTFAEAGGGIEILLSAGADGMTGVTPAGGGVVRTFQRFTKAVPAAIAKVQVGYFESPWYLTGERIFTAGDAIQQDKRVVWFTLFEPQGDAPKNGWPVMLYCNGYRSHRHHAWPLAEQLASEGWATLAINTVGHGGGPDGNIQIAAMTVSDGGRAVDTDGDGVYALEEGMRAAWLGPNKATIRGLTDGVRQTVVDFMSAIRVIDAGLGPLSTSPADRGYFGISNGGRIGGILMGVDPRIPTAVLNVPPSAAFVPLADQWRSGWSLQFSYMKPALNNAPHPVLDFFTEDIPWRGEPVQVGLVEGAEAIHAFIDRARWAATPMNAAAYANRYAVLGKKVMVQVARGDAAVNNPSTADLIREGGLQSSSCLVWPRRSKWESQISGSWLGSIHVFSFMPYIGPNWHPGVIGQGARDQISAWISSRGTALYDPDSSGNLFGQGDVFEVPISDESMGILNDSFGYEATDL
jgi:hypothetical protein